MSQQSGPYGTGWGGNNANWGAAVAGSTSGSGTWSGLNPTGGGDIGAIIGLGSAILGGWWGDKSAREESGRNRDWQENFYKHRYQWQMADMQKAGLNPILAYQQGAGSVPSGGVAAQGELGRRIAEAPGQWLAFQSARAGVNSAQAAARSANAQADVDEARRDALLNRGTVTREEWRVKPGQHGYPLFKPDGSRDPRAWERVPGNAGPSLLEEGLRNDVRATAGSAAQSEAIAKTQESIQMLNRQGIDVNNRQMEWLQNQIDRNDMPTSEQVKWMFGASAANAVSNVLGTIISKKMPNPGYKMPPARPPVGF